MSTGEDIFGLDKEYRASRRDDYNLRKLGDSDTVFRSKKIINRARKSIELLDMRTPSERKSKKMFDYLQLIGYLADHYYKDGPSFLAGLEHLSRQYDSQYRSILKEISHLVSKDERSMSQLESSSDGGAQCFPDSIHTVQQIINVIAYGLANDYGNAISRLDENVNLFREKLLHFERDYSAQTQIPESIWDTFYRLISFNLSHSWEGDLLAAFKIIRESLSTTGSAADRYSRMLCDGNIKIGKEDFCSLVYVKGEIIEMYSPPSDLLTNEVDIADYLIALKQYVDKHKGEIAQRVFCIDSVTRNDTKRIVNRFELFSGYWKLEKATFGRNSFLSRVKLISAYQAIFLSMKSAGFSPQKPGTPKTTDGKREKNSLSSSYSNPETKNGFYLLLLCIWTDYLTVRNMMSAKYAQLYLDINSSALSALLNGGRKLTAWELQDRAEQILFITIETLVPEEDDKDELRSFVKEIRHEINESLLVNWTNLQTNRFGAYCRVFNGSAIARIVDREVRKWDRATPLDVPVHEASEQAVQINQLLLQINYDSSKKMLLVSSFRKCKRQMPTQATNEHPSCK